MFESPDDERAGPAWFVRALAQSPEYRTVAFREARLAYRHWAGATGPSVVLIHDVGACAAWWDHIAPQLSGCRVVALDLSGHGESDHRATYDMDTWAAEVQSVIETAKLDRPVLVGHGWGARVATKAAIRYASSATGLVLLGSPPGHSASAGYAAADEAICSPVISRHNAAFPFIRSHIARASLREDEGRYAWKLDARVREQQITLPEVPRPWRVPAVSLRGERQSADPALDLSAEGRVIDLPDAGQAPMLDQPLVLVTALNALLHAWPSETSTSTVLRSPTATHGT